MLQRPIPWAVALNQPKLGKVWVKFGTSLGKVWNFFGGKLGTSLGKSLELVWGKVRNLFREKFGAWSVFGERLGTLLGNFEYSLEFRGNFFSKLG